MVHWFCYKHCANRVKHLPGREVSVTLCDIIQGRSPKPSDVCSKPKHSSCRVTFMPCCWTGWILSKPSDSHTDSLLTFVYFHRSLCSWVTTWIHFLRQIPKRQQKSFQSIQLEAKPHSDAVQLIKRRNKITKHSTLVTCPKRFSFLSFFFQSESMKWFRHEGEKTSQKKKKKNSIVKNQPHPSGFNLEHKNKKKWTQAETNTCSKPPAFTPVWTVTR